VTTDAFSAACNEALSWIGVCLASAQMDWGSTDFPEDGGVAYRNRLYSYAYSYFEAVIGLLAPDSTDPWKLKNEQRVVALTDSKLIKMAGLSHVHAQGRVLHNTLEHARRNSALNPRLVQSAGKSIQTSLDWMRAAYTLPESIPMRWHKMIVSSSDHSAYLKESIACFYSELASALDLDSSDTANAECWSGLSFLADINASQRPAVGWEELCRDHFTGYTEEATKLRKPATGGTGDATRMQPTHPSQATNPTSKGCSVLVLGILGASLGGALLHILLHGYGD